jgi:hypothetical protein
MHAGPTRTFFLRQQEHATRERVIGFANPHPLRRFIDCPGLFRGRFGREIMAVDEFEPGPGRVEIPHSIKDFLIPALLHRVARQGLGTDVNDAGDVYRQLLFASTSLA